MRPKDAREQSRGAVVQGDVCIVGGGAAGISLAREWIGRGEKVILLESGSLQYDPDIQALNRGELAGRKYFPLESTRLRYFGGTTNHWGGYCRPLDPIVFEKRDWIPHSGWPFSRRELDPYYERAQKVLAIGPYRYDVEFWSSKKPGIRSVPFKSGRIVTTIFQHSEPVRFGPRYLDELSRAPNIELWFNANVLEILLEDSAKSVSGLRVTGYKGNEFTVRARSYVLAAGAIENARLLLSSNRVETSGVGNSNGLVGRFFTEHPHLTGGVIAMTDPQDIERYDSIAHFFENRYRVYATLGLSDQAMREEKLPNLFFYLHSAPSDDVTPGVRSFNLLRYLRARGEFPERWAEHVWNIVREIGNVGSYYSNARSGKGPRSSPKAFVLGNMSEQVPNPESRVTLSSTEKDPFGIPRARLDWRLTSADLEHLRRGQELLGRELGASGLGRLKTEVNELFWETEMEGGHHQMGTTRMHSDPKNGVVDANQRVHGKANLYVTGSSVFPTCGASNPTLTVVALALRLADHLKKGSVPG